MMAKDAYKLVLLLQAILAMAGYVDYTELLLFIGADLLLWWALVKHLP